MDWKIILIIIIVRYAYQFYSASKKPIEYFPSEFEEIIKIIEETPQTFIHSPTQVSEHRYALKFDVRLITGKANGKVCLDYEQSDLTINIAYPILVPEKYMESCYNFIGIVNSSLNNWNFELNHLTRFIAIDGAICFEPGIGVLPPDADQYLNNLIQIMNQYSKGFLMISMEGLSAEEAIHFSTNSNILNYKTK